jgi:excinuclease UvrABC ATPase subunit
VRTPTGALEIRGATAYNLRDVDVDIDIDIDIDIGFEGELLAPP